MGADEWGINSAHNRYTVVPKVVSNYHTQFSQQCRSRMPPGWALLVAANVLVGAYKKAPPKWRLLGWPSRVGWEDAAWVTGAALEEGRWWVLLTATLDHANTPHLVRSKPLYAWSEKGA